MARTLHQALVDEIGLFLSPLIRAAHSRRTRRELFAALGWRLEVLPGLSVTALDDALTAVLEAYTSVKTLAEQDTIESLDTLLALVDAIDDVWTAVERLQEISDRAGVPELEGLRHVGQELINFLSTRYLSIHHPALYELLTLLTLVRRRDPPEPVVIGNPPTVVRVRRTRPELRLDRIVPLLRDPVGFLRDDYLGERGLRTGEDAQRVADRIFPHLGGLLAALGVPTYYGLRPDPDAGRDFGPLGNELAPGVLAIFLPPYEVAGEVQAGGFLGFALSSEDRGNLGLVVVPVLALRYENGFRDWRVIASLEQQVAAFAVGPTGFHLQAGPEVAGVHGSFTATTLRHAGEEPPDAEEAPAFRIGSATGTRLEVGSVDVEVFCDLDTQHQDYGVRAAVRGGALVVSAADGDGFLEKALQRGQLRTEFDVDIGWSTRAGLTVSGGAGLEATIPIHKSIFGALTIETLHLAIQPGGVDDVPSLGLEISATGSLQLGPVTAAIDRVGIATEVAFPAGRGNLGPLAVDRLPAFKPPVGVGLVIDAGPIVGAGYLSFDGKKQEYSGTLQLEIQETISLAAIGLLTTRMPDGSRGFSLIVIITAEGFAPIPLGYGFTLNGVGGLFGVNRTVALPVLRAGIKQGTLNSILFPPDPVRNAPQIISDLRAVFPAAEGRYVFGPMAILGWGTPTVLTLELAVILELPAPVRLILLGRLKALLPAPDEDVQVPSEDLALVRLQMDALGIVEFDSGKISLDATLYDSRLLQYTLTGDMAMRANVGPTPAFVLAVGGFHPRFAAPPGFPALDRIAISLATGNNPRLRLDAYFALTSNTAQFGARVELYAKKGGFTLEGSLGFDALFQFDPFQFVADVGGRVTVRRGGRKLAAVKIDMVLTGPAPLHARGKATFEVLGMKESVRFSATFGGENRSPVPAAAIDVMPLFLEAIKDPRNWSGQLPADGHALVTFRERPAHAAVRVHPAATLTLRQRVVPLNVSISRYGHARPSGATRFAITRVTLSGHAVTAEAVTDRFAPAQFLEMTDDEKLASPSFESFQAGVGVGRGALATGPGMDVLLAFKTTVIDPRQASFELAPEPLPAAAAASQSRLGAAGRSPLGRSGRSKYRTPGRPVSVMEPSYTVAATDTAEPRAIPGSTAAMPYAVAVETLRTHFASNPQDRGRLDVRAAHMRETP